MGSIVDCPRHEGAYDCTAFCEVCEGEQRYEWTALRPCTICGDAIDHDIWFEELGMCVECSYLYWSHLDDDHQCSWSCQFDLPETIKKIRGEG